MPATVLAARPRPVRRPRGTDPCDDCARTGRVLDTITTYVDDDPFGDVDTETIVDAGPCEACDGRGWHPAETVADRAARVRAEVAAAAVARAEAAAAHVATPGKCSATATRSCHWPACPTTAARRGGAR